MLILSSKARREQRSPSLRRKGSVLDVLVSFVRAPLSLRAAFWQVERIRRLPEWMLSAGRRALYIILYTLQRSRNGRSALAGVLPSPPERKIAAIVDTAL